MFDTKDNLYPFVEILPVLLMFAVIIGGLVAVCLLGRDQS